MTLPPLGQRVGGDPATQFGFFRQNHVDGRGQRVLYPSGRRVFALAATCTACLGQKYAAYADLGVAASCHACGMLPIWRAMGMDSACAELVIDVCQTSDIRTTCVRIAVAFVRVDRALAVASMVLCAKHLQKATRPTAQRPCKSSGICRVP